jgi:hypothetical protein
MLEPDLGEVTGRGRKLCNEELHNFYSSVNLIKIFKSREMRWMKQIESMRDHTCVQNFVHKVAGQRFLEKPD